MQTAPGKDAGKDIARSCHTLPRAPRRPLWKPQNSASSQSPPCVPRRYMRVYNTRGSRTLWRKLPHRSQMKKLFQSIPGGGG